MPESATLRRHSLWMISGHSIGVLFQAVYFVLIGRTLGSEQYGAFVGVVALVNVMSQFSSLGMELILVRDVSRDRERFAAAWGTALRVTMYGFMLLLAAAILIGHFTLRPELRIMVPYVALSDALFGKIVQLAGRAFQGAGDLAQTARLTALTNVARAIAAAGFFLYAVFRHVHADAYLWTRVYWISSLAAAAFALFQVTRRLGGPAYRRIRRKDLIDGLSYSLSSSAISIYNDIDKTILAGSGQLYAAGIYAAAYRIIDVASIPIYAVYSAASPRFFREGEGSIDNVMPLVHRLLRRTIPYGIFFAVLLVAGAPLAPRIFGKSFAGVAEVLCWLCLLPLIRGLHYAWGTAITGSSSQWYRTATQAGVAVLNLALNIFWIPLWSWRGAALASLVADGLLALSNWLIVCWLRSQQQKSLEHMGAPVVQAVPYR